MLFHRRTTRRVSALLIGVFVVAGCAGADDPPPSTTTTTTTASPVTAAPDASGATVPDPDEGDEAAVEPGPSTVSEAVVGSDIDAVLEVQIDPDGLADPDPFGRFAACSGLTTSLGNYGVLVSEDSGPVRAVSVLSIGRVSGPGIHDADVRVELESGDPIVAVGTLTIEAGLRSGTFVAFESDGRSINGSFDCDGDGPPPAPLTPGPDDRVVDTVEAVVLLRNNGAERVLGFVVDTLLSSADVECPGVGGATTGLLVRVDGERTIGSIMEFELTDGDTSSMRIRAGGRSFEFDGVEVVVDGQRTSGTFNATSTDGVSADGAYSCS